MPQETGWEYLVMLTRGQAGVYHWDEVNPHQNAYIFAGESELEVANTVCGLQNVVSPSPGVQGAKKCPRDSKQTVPCFSGVYA